MKIGEAEISVAQLTEALQEEGNKGDFDALRGNDLFKREVTQEGVSEYLGTTEGAKLLQPYQDKAVTKGLATHLEKNKDKYIDKATYEAQVKENSDNQLNFDTQLKAIAIDSAIKTELLKGGLKSQYVEMIASNVNKEGLVMQNGKLIGMSEIITGAKETYKDLFGATVQTLGNVSTGANGATSVSGGAGKLSREDLAKLPMADRMAYKVKNPDYYKK